MKKTFLKNSRARRMLNLLSPNVGDQDDENKISCDKNNEVFEIGNEINEKDFQDSKDGDVGCSHQEQEKETDLVETFKSLGEGLISETDIVKKYNTRENLLNKNYDERDNDNCDFSPESSEYIPSPCREVTSDTLSATSSIGGDTFFIDKLINSNIIRSPSTISNLSLVFDNVDFVASPSAIYKISNKRVNQEFPQHHKNITRNDVQNCSLELQSVEQQQQQQSTYLSTIYQDNIFLDSDITLTPNSMNRTLKADNSTIEYSAIDGTQTMNSYTDDLHKRNSFVSSCNNIAHESNQTNVNINEGISPERLNNAKTVQAPQLTSSPILNHENHEEILQKFDNIIEQNKPSTSENKKLCRKRKCNTDEWIDVKNKLLKNSGEAYTGCRSKKSYPAKTIGPVCSYKKQCYKKISTEQRQHFFDTFYRLKSHELQWQYITRRIISKPIKRLTLGRKNNRTQTLIYSFPLDGCDISVCKTYFINTLRISEQVVYTALEKINKDQSLTDDRGTHLNRPHKTNVTTKEIIMKHINLFPVVESHYVRKESTRLYLSEQLNISKMYRLYQSWFTNQNYAIDNFATKRQYETIFNTEYNYSFFKPKKDLCAICALYEQAEDTKKVSLEESYRGHLERKNKVRETKREEKATVDSKNTTVAVFDLEKVLNVPQSEVGIFHYKRKYPIYNFTIYNTLNRSGFCYVWHLSIAKRGSNEIGSCLLQFLKQEAQKGIKHVSFYSDGCAGQNKNRFIYAMYLYALKTYGLESITYRFFETGHSQSEGDSMHSCVERAMKNKLLFTPDQVYSVIMNAKVKGEKYNVKEMEQSDFYDLKCLISGKNWLKDTQGRKILWSKVMEVKVSHERPRVLQLKYNIGEEHFDLDTDSDIAKSKRGRRPKNPVEITTVDNLTQIYHQPIPIPKPLYDDLLGLCASEAIPKHYHGFYNSLVCSGNSEHQNTDDLDGSDLDDA